MIRLQNTWLFL